MAENNDLMEQYFQEKGLYERNQILKKIVLNLPEDGKDFFFKAYKKERNLDMKLCSVRGYAAYATEDEVAKLMDHLLELLKRIPSHTPYDYDEYESMRSVFLMPFLIEKYGYRCFKEFNNQLEEQYNAMPDCFKNIYSLDENGNSYNIRAPKEVSESWQKFWSERRSEG